MSLSTHVLDAATGSPASDLRIALFRVDDGGPDGGAAVADGVTNHDGRCPELSEAARLTAGVYRLRFETGEWFTRTGTAAFYPVVDVTFEVTDPAAHHHVPLLLSPFAFSTYRGS